MSPIPRLTSMKLNSRRLRYLHTSVSDNLTKISRELGSHKQEARPEKTRGQAATDWAKQEIVGNPIPLPASAQAI